MYKEVSKELAIEISTKICGYVEEVDKGELSAYFTCRAGLVEVHIKVDYYPNKSVALEHMKYPHGFIRIAHLRYPRDFFYKNGEIVFY